MRIFTEKQYRRHVAAIRAEAMASAPLNDPAYVLMLYSENEQLLKHAAAAYHGIPEDKFECLKPSSMQSLFRPISRMMRELAVGLQKVRPAR